MSGRVRISIDRIVVPQGAGVDRASLERAIAREVERQLGGAPMPAASRNLGTIETRAAPTGSAALGAHIGSTIVRKGMA